MILSIDCSIINNSGFTYDWSLKNEYIQQTDRQTPSLHSVGNTRQGHISVFYYLKESKAASATFDPSMNVHV